MTTEIIFIYAVIFIIIVMSLWIFILIAAIGEDINRLNGKLDEIAEILAKRK